MRCALYLQPALAATLLLGCGIGSSDEGGASTHATEGTSTTTGTPGCGDGILVGPETCDDGNTIDGDGCNQNCQISGSLVWCNHELGEDDSGNSATAVAIDGQGNAVLTGGLLQKSVAPGVQGFVAKYDPDGGLMWLKHFSGDEPGSARGYGIVVDSANIIHVTMALGSTHTMLHLNATGSTISSFDIPEIDPVGDNLRAGPDGYFGIIGTTPTAPRHAVLAEFKSDGTLIWKAILDDLEAGSRASALHHDPQGPWLLAGTTVVRTIPKGNDIPPQEFNAGFVRKFSNEGQPLWTHQIESTDDAFSVILSGIGSQDASRMYVAHSLERPAPDLGLGTTLTLTVLDETGQVIAKKLLTSEEFGVLGSQLLVLRQSGVDTLLTAGSIRPAQYHGLINRHSSDGTLQWLFEHEPSPGLSSSFSASAASGGTIYSVGSETVGEPTAQRVLVCKLNQ